ncbi:hypothetical protein FRC02_001021 [Tulasnella sp. 418]|nr:hypothetical protein FRC02_001021 [Tulasnella sp. 418]
MFGCCVAGRLPQTNLNQIDETHVTFSIPNAETVGHVVVFLLGTVPFPPGYGATVHFEWPGRGFQLLGMLSNDKPSAIFRLRNNNAPQSSAMASQQTTNVTATVGISIEPIDAVLAQTASLPAPGASTTGAPTGSQTIGGLSRPISSDPTLLAERIVLHLWNHLSSFGESLGPQTMVPLGVIQKWYENFLHKIKAGGISFLERKD